MTAEEFIKSVSVEDCAGGHIYRRVSEDNALKAIEMTRREKAQTFVGMQILPQRKHHKFTFLHRLNFRE